MFEAFELPHFNCILADFNGNPINQDVNLLVQPYELYHDQANNKYWLQHNQVGGGSVATIYDNATEVLIPVDAVAFRPNERPRID